jgi:hypothetical protein
MFQSANFAKLKSLDLSTAIFAAKNMNNSQSQIGNASNMFSASRTFNTATFTNLTNLKLGNMVTPHMGYTVQGAQTGYCTFVNAIFTSLETIDLRGSTMYLPDAISGTLISMASTFSGAQIPNLKSLYLDTNAFNGMTSIHTNAFAFSATGRPATGNIY